MLSTASQVLIDLDDPIFGDMVDDRRQEEMDVSAPIAHLLHIGDQCRKVVDTGTISTDAEMYPSIFFGNVDDLSIR